MKIEPQNIYHIYNRGNNQQIIFFNRENYLFFLNKIKKHLNPLADILCWCLMPNHFHLLIHAKNSSDSGPSDEYAINKSIGIILRSYTRAIQKQEQKTGSLFQQKTRVKNLLASDDINYPAICFHYIHQNPFKANLVTKMEDWEFCSFKDYAGLRNGTLCNQQLAKQLLDLPADKNELYKLSYEVYSSDDLKSSDE